MLELVVLFLPYHRFLSWLFIAFIFCSVVAACAVCGGCSVVYCLAAVWGVLVDSYEFFLLLGLPLVVMVCSLDVRSLEVFVFQYCLYSLVFLVVVLSDRALELVASMSAFIHQGFS